MKSQARKKRLAREAAKYEAVQEARNNNPYLMRVYSAFLPGYMKRGLPKYVTDKYGNRILAAEFKLTPDGLKRIDPETEELVNG